MSREVITWDEEDRRRALSVNPDRSVSKGMRMTKTLGVRRIRRCKDCGRKFTPRTRNHQQESSASELSNRG